VLSEQQLQHPQQQVGHSQVQAAQQPALVVQQQQQQQQQRSRSPPSGPSQQQGSMRLMEAGTASTLPDSSGNTSSSATSLSAQNQSLGVALDLQRRWVGYQLMQLGRAAVAPISSARRAVSTHRPSQQAATHRHLSPSRLSRMHTSVIMSAVVTLCQMPDSIRGQLDPTMSL
jgi:hypothetical protein